MQLSPLFCSHSNSNHAGFSCLCFWKSVLGCFSSPGGIQPSSQKPVLLQAGSRAVLGLVDCLHHLVIPRTAPPFCLKRKRIVAEDARDLWRGEGGERHLKHKYCHKELVFSPQHHNSETGFSSDTPFNTKLSTSESHLCGYQMNYTGFTGLTKQNAMGRINDIPKCILP